MSIEDLSSNIVDTSETCRKLLASRRSLSQVGLAVFACLLCLTPIAAGAETAAQDEPLADPEEEVEIPALVEEIFVEGVVPAVPTSNTVAAKLPLSLRETPFSVGVVEESLIEDQGGFVLGDALRNVSGLQVQPGSGTFDFFVVRGLDSLSSGLILTDGAPEPETTSYQLYNVQRVEVLKGPSAFLYGGGPLGGTVNLVRKQPAPGTFVELGGSFGSHSTWEGNLDANLSNPANDLSFRLNSVWQSSDLYRDDKSSDTFAINPSITWRPDDRSSLNLNIEAAEIDYKNDNGLPILFTQQIPDVPRTRSYQSPFDDSEQDVLRVQVDYERRVSERFTLRNKSYLRRLDWQSTSTTFNGVFPNPFDGSLLVSRNLLSLDDTQEFVGNQLEGLWRLETGSVIHHLLVGLEVARMADAFDFDFGFLPEIALDNPVETVLQPILFPAFAVDAHTDVVAPYIVDQIKLSPKVQVLLGVRWDNLDFSDEITGLDRQDDQLSPMAGVVFSPDDKWSIYASYGEAFAPQSTFVVAQGADRQPEESRQLEMGVKRSFLGGKLEASLAVYQVERENIAIPDNLTGVLAQTGDQESKGFELELAGVVRPGLEARLGYAYTDAELTELRELVQIGPTDFIIADRSGNTPPFTPEHLLSLWFRQELAGGWSIGLGGRYQGEQFIDEDNAFELEEEIVLDAALAVELGAWKLSLFLRNLTDEETFSRAAQGNSVIPMAGFTASAGFKVRF